MRLFIDNFMTDPDERSNPNECYKKIDVINDVVKNSSMNN